MILALNSYVACIRSLAQLIASSVEPSMHCRCPESRMRIARRQVDTCRTVPRGFREGLGKRRDISIATTGWITYARPIGAMGHSQPNRQRKLTRQSQSVKERMTHD